ncbi:MAG: hypothetical protein N2Z74_04600, partial [Syntrophales bacterium]|nr:hypothetical protein [Syntrophales bacterium]
AKTVTVGTSRKEQFPEGLIFSLLTELKFPPKRLTARNIVAITKIQPAVASIRGYTLYEVHDLDGDGNPTDTTTITIAARGGISLSMTSRTERSRLLVGTKKSIVSMGHLHIGKGKYDGAPLVVVPLLGEGGTVRHLLLIHIVYNEGLTPAEKRSVLGYKYNDIRNLVQEYNLPWDDAYLADITTAELFSETPEVLAGRIKNTLNGGR